MRLHHAAPMIVAAVLLGGCGSSSGALASARPGTPTATPAPTPSTASPAGAMAGFLAAARAQDNTKVQTWMATDADTSSVKQALDAISLMKANLFWEVDKLSIKSVATQDSTHAWVTLSGDIVWCVGQGLTDAQAECSWIAGPSSAPPHTYLAVKGSDGTWKVDVDINIGNQLNGNPEAPTATPAPATPTPPPASAAASPSPT